VVVVEVKEEGTMSHLRVAFTSASRTRAALVVSGTIWGSKCFVEAALQVVDDDVVEVVDEKPKLS
jgi:hypothetical protein